MSENELSDVAQEDLVVELDELTVEEPTEEAIQEEPEETAVDEAALELDEVDEVITQPEPTQENPKPSASIMSGTIGSPSAGKKDKAKKSAATTIDKVAVFSSKNVSSPSLGKLYRGYNIISKAAADKWLERSYVRLATPEEVAREFKK